MSVCITFNHIYDYFIDEILAMKKLILITCLTCLLSACGNTNSDSEHPNTGKSLKLVGYHQNALTLREMIVPTKDSSLKVTCYLDEMAKEVCKGEFENGETATSEQVQTVLGSIQIDPDIEESLKSGCNDKTLLLVVEPKMTIPEFDESDFCFWTDENNTIISCDGKVVSQEEAEALNAKRLEKLKADLSAARKASLETFMANNPNLVSENKAQSYLDVLYGGLDIKLEACDWTSFIDKNHDILDIVELRAIVNKDTPTTCTTSVEHTVLLKANNYNVDTNTAPSFKRLSTKEELVAYKSFGLNDNVIDAIDFTKDMVLYLSAGQKPTTGYSLKIDDICVDSKIEVHVDHCAGQSEDDAHSEPLMLLQLPNDEYEVEFINREIICE